VEEQLDQAAALVQEVFSGELVGLYLFGSAVLGGLRPTSDLDLLAVSRRPTTPEERRRLAERLLALSKRPRHLELTIVVQSEVRPWRYPPRMDFQYGDWLRAELERGEIPPPAPNPDVAAEWSIARLPEAHRPVLERARDGYRSGDYGTWDDLDIRACAAYLVGEIRRSRPRRGASAPR